MRQYLNNTVFALLPDELQALIAPTTIVQIVDGERVETEDKLFLLSKTQVFGKGRWSDREPEDTQLLCFLREKDRVKECGDNGTWWWWLRSPEASSSSSFAFVYIGGTSHTANASVSYGVAFGSSRARQSSFRSEIRAEWREGVLDLPAKVNICPDASGRTLLAWYGLQVIPRFMPGDATCLLQPANRHTGQARFHFI